jgi:C2 domain
MSSHMMMPHLLSRKPAVRVHCTGAAIWGETFEVKISQPSLALLSIIVMDRDTGANDDFIAYATMPVSGIRKGYRRVALYSSDGTTHGEFKHASLMCRFDPHQPESE